MDLLEYQGKQLFARHGVPVPAGQARADGGGGGLGRRGDRLSVRVKAQVQIGGRGKLAGSSSPMTAPRRRSTPRAILGMDIRGLTVYELWIEGASEIASEYYASVIFDRCAKAPLVMLSTKGGMDIEASPRRTRRRSPGCTSIRCSASRTSTAAALRSRPASTPTSCARSARCSRKLYDVFVAEEATLVEVNPLIVTPDRQVRALDAKVTLDGNALFRHPENAALRDPSAEDPQERMAKERGLTYVKLDGNIGILGNGAGLVDVDARRRQARGRRAGELPRRRRRLQGRRDHQRGRGDPLQREGEGGAVQHLRRHHPLRRGRARA